MKKNLCLVSLFLVLGVFLTPASARSDEKVFVLTLDQVIELALRNNFEIQLARYDADISRTKEYSARSLYDTILAAEAKYQNDKSARALSILGTKSLENDYNVSLSQKLPTGTTLTTGVTNARAWNNSAFATLNPSHDTTLSLSIEQNLLRNFLGIEDRGMVRLTLAQIAAFEFTSQDSIEFHLLKVIRDYWDIILEQDRLKVSQDLLELAKKLYEFNHEKAKSGLVEEPELLASRANYIRRQNDLWLAENALKSKINILKYDLNISDEDIALQVSGELTMAGAEESFGSVLKTAFANRFDLQRSLKELKSKDIKLTITNNSRFPELNLSATLAQNGLSAQDFRGSWNAIDGEDHFNTMIGLTFKMPLQNQQAVGDFKQAKLEKARAILAHQDLERKVAVEVTNQLSDLVTLREVARAAEEVAHLEQAKLEQEGKRFQFGRSSTDTLIRFQDDQRKAQIELLEARHRYQVSRAQLERGQGVLLKKYWREN